jgi:maleate cis-trans isomerase
MGRIYRIGQIVPSSNTTMETGPQRTAPEKNSRATCRLRPTAHGARWRP